MHRAVNFQNLPHAAFVQALTWMASPVSFLELAAFENNVLSSVLRAGELEILDAFIKPEEKAEFDLLLKSFDWEGNLQQIESGEIVDIPAATYDLVHVDRPSDFIELWRRTGELLIIKNIYMTDVWRSLAPFLNLYQCQVADVDVSLEGSGTIALWRRKRNQ